MLETGFGCVSQQGLYDSQSQPTRHQTSGERSPTAGYLDADSGCWTIRSSVVTYDVVARVSGVRAGPCQALSGSEKCYTPDSGHPQPRNGGFTSPIPWNRSWGGGECDIDGFHQFLEAIKGLIGKLG